MRDKVVALLGREPRMFELVQFLNQINEENCTFLVVNRWGGGLPMGEGGGNAIGVSFLSWGDKMSIYAFPTEAHRAAFVLLNPLAEIVP